MPTWGEINQEFIKRREKGEQSPDPLRREFLSKLHGHTQRDTILYASNWTQPKDINPGLLSIIPEDIQGFMEVIYGLKGPNLDLILHSPGGSAEVTEALVIYLRSKFNHIRAIIPHAAMSAATMFACACDEIVMGKHSFLGPIDPQMNLNTRLGPMSVPAQAILDEFEKAKIECQDPRKIGVWLPIIEQFGPALIIQCENAKTLAKNLVGEWLETNMFKKDPNGKERAQRISEYLSNHDNFKTHGRHIDRKKLESLDIKIEYLEKDPKLQDLVLSVFHATTITFDQTPAVKIIENNNGKAFVRLTPTISLIQGEPTIKKPKKR